MLLIDPHRDGCTVWVGYKVQNIKGDIVECCERIRNFVTCLDEDNNRYQVFSNILLDTAGIGMVYADYFRHNGINFKEVKPGNIL